MIILGVEFTTAEFILALMQLLNMILIFVLLRRTAGKKEEKLQPAAVKSVPAASEEQDDLELVAVLTAAVAAYEGTTEDKVRILDFREVEGNDRITYRSNWSIVGRREQVNRYI